MNIETPPWREPAMNPTVMAMLAEAREQDLLRATASHRRLESRGRRSRTAPHLAAVLRGRRSTPSAIPTLCCA